MGIDFEYISGQTPLDEDEKEGLLIESLSSRGELDEFEQLNIERAIEWSISRKFVERIILTEEFVKSLHKQMFGEVWSWAGQFRKSNKNIGVDWTIIGIELKKLLDDTEFWIKNRSYNPDEIAIRFKHRLVRIHCFPNGNGRHSRMMADIIIESIFEMEYLTGDIPVWFGQMQPGRSILAPSKKRMEEILNPCWILQEASDTCKNIFNCTCNNN